MKQLWYIIAALSAGPGTDLAGLSAAEIGDVMPILNFRNALSEYSLLVQIIHCVGVLVIYIVPCLAVLLPIRMLTKLPSFIFRKLLHIVAFAGVSLMILFSKGWYAAVLTSLLLAVIIYPILTVFEKKPWFGNLFVQKTPGEIKKSFLLLFLMFGAVIAAAWGILDRPHLAAAAILMWGTGDAAAALIGVPFGRHKVRSRFTDGKKSWEGSLAMLLVSFATGLAVLLLVQKMGFFRAILAAGTGAVVGTLTELVSPSELDTVTVPISIVIFLLLLGL